MIYFAYGSNLDRSGFLETCPHAILLEPAVLEHHRLWFPRWSIKRQCAVASIEEIKGHNVWGLLYRLTDRCWAALDGREGYVGPNADNRYDRVEKTVMTRGGDEVGALTYIAKPETNPGYPSAHYISLMLGGAKAYNFPNYTLEMLRGIKTGPRP